MAYGAVIRYPGSKWKLSDKIIKLFPDHKVYLEPYFGSGAVLINKKPVRLETVNDIDGNVVNLYKCIRDYPEKLSEKIYFTPYSREEHEKSFEFLSSEENESIELARKFLVYMWQSYGPRTTGAKTGWNRSLSFSSPNRAAQWGKLPDLILKIAERLKNVQIENKDALDLIKEYDFENSLIYIDPPYLKNTRRTHGDMYRFEYNEGDHIKLLETVLKNKHSKIMISSYESTLYDKYLSGWSKEEFKSYAVSNKERKEVLYCNFKIKSKLF